MMRTAVARKGLRWWGAGCGTLGGGDSAGASFSGKPTGDGAATGTIVTENAAVASAGAAAAASAADSRRRRRSRAFAAACDDLRLAAARNAFSLAARRLARSSLKIPKLKFASLRLDCAVDDRSSAPSRGRVRVRGTTYLR